MRPSLIRIAALSALLAGVSLATAPDPAVADRSSTTQPTSTCLWFGPTFTADDSELNYAYPDSGALYWAAHFAIPTGATLELQGEFAHARYQSLNAYNTTNKAPIDAVNDVSTHPDAGSINPYLPHAKRDSKQARDYAVTVSSQPPPSGARDTNTLYAGVPGQSKQLLLFRLYLPDTGTGPTGGVALPRPVLTLADGTTVTGDAACAALSSDLRTPTVELMAPTTYSALRDQPGKPATFPSTDPLAWHTFYNPQHTTLCAYRGLCDGTPARIGGQYSNVDNAYVSGHINRGFGEVVMLRGKLPRTPATLDDVHKVDRKVDMRYWSLCTNETSVTTRVEDCVYDEQVVTDKHGWYTIVISRTGDRPANATTACGVNWVAWPERGDGAGHPDDGFLILRNMLPSATFPHAVQNTSVPGDEKQVMGDYLPTNDYSSRAEFEARGCAR